MVKILVIGIIFLFIGVSFSPITSGKLLKNDIKKNINSFNQFILDQYQENFNLFSGSVIDTDQKLAQSFKPTLDNLAKIDLAIRKFPLTNESLVISISENLDGSNLISFTIPASQISDSSNSWHEFILPELITLIPENTYYIVTETEGFVGYSWGTNFSNLYTRGCFWYYAVDNGYWKHVSDEDLAFRTYGLNNTPPDKPIINGPKTGKPGDVYSCSLIAIDPDNDNIYYEIDWGDGIVISWDGPHESNEKISKDHVYLNKAEYTIMARAKDTNGDIGEWGELKVNIAKNKILTNIFFQRFLQNPLQLFLSLQKLLNSLE